MSKVVHLSEAFSIGLHGIILIARAKDSLTNVQKIAGKIDSSQHHVAKVFQRLVKSGFLYSHRGPTGGFTLRMSPEEISFLDIFQEIEGKVNIDTCPFDHPVCKFETCIMGNINKDLSRQFIDFLESHYVSDYVDSEAEVLELVL